MSSPPAKAAELGRKARAHERQEHVAQLEHEQACLAELSQHLTIDIQRVEAQLDAARAKCRQLADELALHEQKNHELDQRIAAASDELKGLEEQVKSSQTSRDQQGQELGRLQRRMRAEQTAQQTAERELHRVVESLQRLSYAAEHWTAESSR